MAVKKELIARFAVLFRGREDAYGQYTVGDDGVSKVSVSTLTGEAPFEAWQRHLGGRNPGIGMIPLTRSGNCYWGAIDFDDPADPFEIADRVEKAGLPLIVARSKSGGVHLYVFLVDPVMAEIMIRKLKAWANMLGLGLNLQGKKGKSYPVEIFPKQTDASTGNWINLPYFGVGKSNLRWGVVKGKRVDLAEWVAHVEASRLSSIKFSSMAEQLPGAIFADGPPCLESFHTDGVAKGGRNIILFNMGLFFKQSQPDVWQQALVDYNEEHVDPPLERKELDITIKQIEGGTYWYQCDQSPLCDVCDAKLCAKRRWGIESFKTGIPGGLGGKLTYLAAEPARWILAMEGKDIIVTTPQLLSSQNFRLAVVEQLGIYFPPVKQPSWDRFIRKAMETKTTITPPREAGVFGRFLTLLGQFVEQRRGATSDSDLRRGKPVEKVEDGQVYVVFTLEGLRIFLERNHFYDYKDTDLYTRLKTLHAVSKRMRVDEALMRVWWVPFSELSEFVDDADINPSHSEGPAF